MSWNEEAVLQAANTVEFGGALWILYLAGNTDVGVGKTSDYHTLRNSVRSYAQDQGLDDPGHPTVKNGFANISRKVVVDSDGNRDTINNEHKNHIVSLTSLGKGLMNTVHNDDQIENALKESIEIEVDEPQDPWWPEDGPQDSFNVFLHTYADRTVLREDHAEIEAHAIFDCPCCGEQVENDFELTLQDGYIVEGWQRFPEVECANCNNTYNHSAANPHYTPESME